MLEKNRDVTASRPLFAEKLATPARTAQPVTKQDDWGGLVSRRQINPHRDVTVTSGIVHGEIAQLGMKCWIDRERIVRRSERGGYRGARQQQRQQNEFHDD